MEHALAYENAHDLSYAWFVRLRPDALLLEPLPALVNLPPIRLYVQSKRQSNYPAHSVLDAMWWDVLFLVPRSLVSTFKDAMIEAFTPRPQSGGGCFMGASQMPCTSKTFDVGCVRSSGTPEAAFTSHWVGLGAPYFVYPFGATLYKASRPQGPAPCDIWASARASVNEDRQERPTGLPHPLTIFGSTWGVANTTTGPVLWTHYMWCKWLNSHPPLDVRLLPERTDYIDERGRRVHRSL